VFTLPNESLLRMLVCPADHSTLRIENDSFVCENSHYFAMEQGILVFADNPRREPVPLNMDPCLYAGENDSIDSFVNDWIVNTNGNLYWRMRGALPRYPIPDWPFESGDGRVLVDIGCGWGRWSIAAARAGFKPIGMDVHIDALAAASRVAKQFGVQADFICSDAERLPFQHGEVDCVFSYSVLQHLDKARVLRIFQEIARVLKPGGICRVQLPNQFGLLSIFRQFKRGFREPESGTLEMRYWSRNSIRQGFQAVGFSDVAVHTEGFFSQNSQLSDLDLLSPIGKGIVLASHAGRKIAGVVPVLTRIADSLWIEAHTPSNSP
jgi:ubiquinone/menaquinone biosynthesis C-methylase UbiE